MNWTDDRLEERFDAIDQRFDRVEADIRQLRGEVERGFKKSDADLRALSAEMNLRFDSLQRSLFLSASAIVAALIGVIATQL